MQGGVSKGFLLLLFFFSVGFMPDVGLERMIKSRMLY